MNYRSIGLLMGIVVLFGSAAPINAAPVTINFSGTFNMVVSNINGVPSGDPVPTITYDFSGVFDPATVTIQTINTGDTTYTIIDGLLSPIAPYNTPLLALAGGVETHLSLFDSRPNPGFEAGREEGVNLYVRSSASGADADSSASAFLSLSVYAAAPTALRGGPVDGAFVTSFLAMIQQTAEPFTFSSQSDTLNLITGDSTSFYYTGGSAYLTAVNPAGTEVPEPASFALFGAGLLGMIAFRRKRGQPELTPRRMNNGEHPDNTA